MKFYKYLMYMNIKEPTQWDLNNLNHVMLTIDQPRKPFYINNKLEGTVIFTNKYEVDENIY